jgi:hypothetical protein
MKSEVILALIKKIIEEKVSDENSPIRGPRGHRGSDGEDGKSFSFEEHGPIIRKWVEDSALTFSDLTQEQIETLRGPKGRDGRDGSSFVFEEYKNEIENVIHSHFNEIKNTLKIKFDDLTEEEIEQLRGPRGQRGKAGKDFNFDEHLEFFQSLRLKFSDLSPEEVDSLTLTFDKLSQDQKNSLKLTFDQLTDEDKETIRGPRGQRGKHGKDGNDGSNAYDIAVSQGFVGSLEEWIASLKGERGSDGKSIIGPRGDRGIQGLSGRDGRDGEDAPVITSIDIREDGKTFSFIFKFSDGKYLTTPDIDMPKSQVSVYVAGGSMGGGGGSGSGSTFAYLFGLGVPSDSIGLDGNLYQNTSNGDLYKKDSGTWVLQTNITGPQGVAGDDGLSAYEVALANGFVGTEAQWLASLVGPQGPPGSGGGSGTSILSNVPCDTSVYVGAAVILVQDSPVDSFISEWPNMDMITQINYENYTPLVQNALANNFDNSNFIGFVTAKSTPSLCDICISGETPDLFLGLDTKKEYYLSGNIPGGICAEFAVPTAPGTIYLKLGQPTTSKKMLISRGERVTRI